MAIFKNGFIKSNENIKVRVRSNKKAAWVAAQLADFLSGEFAFAGVEQRICRGMKTAKCGFAKGFIFLSGN
jgi:hypothetical protein